MKIDRRGDLADEYENPIQTFRNFFPHEVCCSWCHTLYTLESEKDFINRYGANMCPICKNHNNVRFSRTEQLGYDKLYPMTDPALAAMRGFIFIAILVILFVIINEEYIALW
jgi:hypothetical protein